MRIRKHAKLAGLMRCNAADLLSPLAGPRHISCHLNQSPWDVISFPPDSPSSPYQVDGEDSFTANASFGDSIGAVESVASMKISADRQGKNAKYLGTDHAVSTVDLEDGIDEREDPVVVVCCKTDGKGWKCKKEASEGHLLCEHHLAQLRTYNTLAHPPSKKPTTVAGTSGRRPRAKKASAASNPHEFYYYSGFGPRWGKKRGSKNEPVRNNIRDRPRNIEEEEEVSEATPSSRIEDEEFVYVEDDYDDDEEDLEESGEFGKKRGRKPIKARSLKSLM